MVIIPCDVACQKLNCLGKQKSYLGSLINSELIEINDASPQMLYKSWSVFGNAHCFCNVPNTATADEAGSLHCIRSISVGASRCLFCQNKKLAYSNPRECFETLNTHTCEPGATRSKPAKEQAQIHDFS